MELKEFVKKVILDLDQAVTEANAVTNREIRFKGVAGGRTALEFDVAVTVESTTSGGGGGEIKVWGIGQVGGKMDRSQNNSTVSRVTFGVDVSEDTKIEKAQYDKEFRSQFTKNSPNSCK